MAIRRSGHLQVFNAVRLFRAPEKRSALVMPARSLSPSSPRRPGSRAAAPPIGVRGVTALTCSHRVPDWVPACAGTTSGGMRGLSALRDLKWASVDQQSARPTGRDAAKRRVRPAALGTEIQRARAGGVAWVSRSPNWQKAIPARAGRWRGRGPGPVDVAAWCPLNLQPKPRVRESPGGAGRSPLGARPRVVRWNTA